MDRLFLTGLVRELSPALEGRRIRSVASGAEGVSLTLAGGVELVVSLVPGACGPYRGRASWSTIPAPRLRKRLAGAEIRNLDVAERDRVVQIWLRRVHLSGRTSELVVVLEVVATKVDLFLVERDDGGVIEALSSGRARLGVGERFRPLRPPPGAASPAEDAATFERRLLEAGAGPRPTRKELLAATGWTPLLVRELSYLAEREGERLGRAFERLRERLERPSPVLYVSGSANTSSPVTLAPIALAHLRDLEARPFSSFNEAMEEAVAITLDRRRFRSLQQRARTAVARRLGRVRGLKRKLRQQQSSLDDASELRRRGESLLAGLGQARLVGEDWVRLPDPFDPEGREIRLAVDPRLSLVANAEKYFRLSRKTERTRAELKRRLGVLEGQLEYLENIEMGLDDITELEELQALARELSEQGLLAPDSEAPLKPSPGGGGAKFPPRKFETARGHVILVGRSGRSNEEVTFRRAGARDLWFHAAGIPGAHVVLRLAPGAEPEPDEIEQAASLAAHYSRARADSKVEVMMTERRNVRKLKGAPPGTVKVKDVRTIRVSPRAPQERG